MRPLESSDSSTIILELVRLVRLKVAEMAYMPFDSLILSTEKSNSMSGISLSPINKSP